MIDALNALAILRQGDDIGDGLFLASDSRREIKSSKLGALRMVFS
jgi:hypothetical protein